MKRFRFKNLYAMALAASGSCLSAQESESDESVSLEDLLQIGQEIWEDNAPPELQEEYRLPTMEEIENFLATFEADLAEGSVHRLAAYAPQAKIALAALRQFEGGDTLADWLAPRIDYLDAARVIVNQPPPPQRPSKPAVSPQYTLQYWNDAMATRPMPKTANRYMPVFKKAFRDKGVPPELAWLSEVESSLNLQARSPVGAYGPFQFMPATAERFGLKVGSPDERTHPRKSAEAAASYLAILYKQFHSWPLALAAYNAGEGRVGRALESTGAKSFEELSPHLPTETRMYVPKVLATVATREAIDPSTLPGI